MTLTEYQKRLIRDSFDQVREIAAPLASLFYGRLFATDSSTKPLFKNDIRVQGAKLIDMLSVIVAGLDDTGKLTPTLRALGQRHAGYGVQAEQYNSVNSALQWALSQALELQFESDTRTAWAALLDGVSSEMMAGASELAAASS